MKALSEYFLVVVFTLLLKIVHNLTIFMFRLDKETYGSEMVNAVFSVSQAPDPKTMQINITGFLQAKNAREFMKELWELLVSAQENIGGIPSAFLEKKKEEIKQRKVLNYGVFSITLSLIFFPPQIPFSILFLD